MTRKQLSAILWLLALLTSTVFGKKSAPDLGGVDPAQEVDGIVQFTQTPTAKHHDKVKQLGGRHKQDLSLVRAGLYQIPAGQLKKLAEDPEVAYISPDREVKSTLDYAATTIGAAWPSSTAGFRPSPTI